MQTAVNLSFSQFVDAAEQYLNDIVNDGTDHELFISGYLYGHFSLVVSQLIGLETDLPTKLFKLDSEMRQSLKEAFENKELEEGDQLDVFALWGKVIAMEAISK